MRGGTHVSGFKSALTRVINDYARKNNSLKEGNTLTGDDVREGLTAIISIKLAHPQFEGRRKRNWVIVKLRDLLTLLRLRLCLSFLRKIPAIAKKIVSKIVEAAKARLAAKKARDLVRRKNAFSLGGLPGKLAECSSKKRDNTELYIVEG